MGFLLSVRDEDFPPPIKVDGLGAFYIVFTLVWTAILIAGMVFLYGKRNMPILRLRGLPLSFGAVILMHMYWCAVQIGYIYGAHMAPGVEFWIMSIWFPFGIALFHASNSRFLYVAEMQKRFIGDAHQQPHRSPRSLKRKSIAERFRLLDYTTKMLALVLAGMAFQLFISLFMFIVSRKFHPGFGIPGTEVTGSAAEQKAAASKGWEWWPSVFWQCFWAWLVAPYILWKARGLHDTLGWRTQTIACCISSLHATPMWLVALYVPSMGKVNQYWIPPQWIAISIMLIEIFTIGLPCWEVIKHRTLQQETLDAIARWESRNKNGGSIDTGESSYASWKIGKKGRKAYSVDSSNSSVLTMDALEHTLERNPQPLQNFSALKDFSGENIAFLMRVSQWRNKFWNKKKSVHLGPADEKDAEANYREAFQEALRIYIDFISERGAEFQVNLSSAHFKALTDVFEHAAGIVYGDEKKPDPATPFEMGNWRITGKDADTESQTEITAPETPITGETPIDAVRYWGDIPDAFDANVFDDSEGSIKYLVLTNTWPKFIKARRSSDSIDSMNA